MKNPHHGLSFIAVIVAVSAAAWSGCGSSPDSANVFIGGGGAGSGATMSNGPGSEADGSGTLSTGSSTGALGLGTTGAGGGTPGCTGLQCQIHSCSGGGSTTVSGTIYDPAGKNPLYGIVAYVPNTKPSAFKAGASCYSCGDLYTGDPIAAAVTDPTGKFTIKDVPDGANIPLVIQVGKWRRQFVLPTVTMCKDTAVPAATLTLPKNGGEGDLPDIAISTGSADTLECLLSRIGVDKAEYGPGSTGTGHIHIFKGNDGAPDTAPTSPDPSASLWDSDADIMKYDIVALSCEGQETLNMNQQVLFDYAAAGGRVFASHFHYAWFNTGPFAAENLATWTPGSNNMGDSLMANIVTTLPNNQPFPKGVAMLAWLGNVNALTNMELPIQAPRHNADVGATNTPSQAWIAADKNANPANATQDFSFDAPFNVPAAQQCGRVVFSDMHVGAASGDYNGPKTTPAGCANNELSPQEKALEFILFDLSSCVTPNDIPTPPPPGMPH